MLNVCLNCGRYRADKIIDPLGPYAICPECGHKHSFTWFPLLLVSGASGVGKSSVCRALIGKTNAVLLDSDILWRPEFDKPETKYREYFEIWLRVCKNVAQSGKPVVLFGAGMGVPENMEPCVERRYFSALHYMALICEPETLIERLRKKPKWRTKVDPVFLEEHIKFNQWFKENALKTTPPIDLIETTGISLQKTTHRVANWIHEKLEVTQA